MLVVDVHALHTVGALNLLYQVVLDLLHAAYRQHIMGAYGALRNMLAPLYILALLDGHPGAEGYQIRAALAGLVVGDHHVVVPLYLLKAHLSVKLVYDSHVLGLAALKQLVYAGKTLGDVLGAGHAAGMEGAHGKLCTGFA